jgi:Sigma-70 region 2
MRIGLTGIVIAFSTSRPSETELMRSIAQGDRRAMHVLSARHRLPVHRLVDDKEAAEDLVSEAFLQVWRHAGRFEGRSQVSTRKAAQAFRNAVGFPGSGGFSMQTASTPGAACIRRGPRLCPLASSFLYPNFVAGLLGYLDTTGRLPRWLVRGQTSKAHSSEINEQISRKAAAVRLRLPPASCKGCLRPALKLSATGWEAEHARAKAPTKTRQPEKQRHSHRGTAPGPYRALSFGG